MFGISDIVEGAVKGLVSIVPGLATVIGNVIVKKSDNATAQETDENASGKAAGLAWLQSVNDLNRAKLDHMTERQAMRAFISFVVPTALIWWAACLDSIPFYIPWFMLVPHHVGAWGVDIPPKLQEDFHMVVQSFFVAAPTIAGVAVLAKAFRRGR
jgi:hypothetical protein